MATMSAEDDNRGELNRSNRKAVVAMLVGHTQDGRVKCGAKSLVATKFNVAPCTVGRIYDTVMAHEQGQIRKGRTASGALGGLR